MMAQHESYMRRALELARQAEAAGEVPVGAVVVLDDEIIGEGHNQPISSHDPTAHAEIMALRTAAEHQQNYRLPGARLYVTLEPCCMCAGAIIHARIAEVIYGADDPKTGAAGSRFDTLLSADHNHRVNVEGGLMAETSADLLRRFFRSRRRTGSRD